MLNGLRGAMAAAAGSLLLSSATLVCCALPAAAVAVGAGASLVSLISVFPELVVLSMHKAVTFSLAGFGLAFGYWMQFRQRSAPCPLDQKLAAMCARTRELSLRVYFGSLTLFAVGGFFAFVLPTLKRLL